MELMAGEIVVDGIVVEVKVGGRKLSIGGGRPARASPAEPDLGIWEVKTGNRNL